jgi:hypothetical protein
MIVVVYGSESWRVGDDSTRVLPELRQKAYDCMRPLRRQVSIINEQELVIHSCMSWLVADALARLVSNSCSLRHHRMSRLQTQLCRCTSSDSIIP